MELKVNGGKAYAYTGGKTFDGSVSEIASSPIVIQGQSEGAVEFSVKVVLASPPEAVRPGMSVSGEIQTGEHADVVAIPVQALVLQGLADRVAKAENDARERTVSTEVKKAAKDPKQKDVEGVYLVDGDKAKFVAVKTGLQGDLMIEISEGIKPGDTIVTGPFRTLRTLKDGDAVRKEELDKRKGPGGSEKKG